MSRILRALFVAALASSTTLAQAQQPQPGQIQPGQIQPGQVQPGQVQPGRPGVIAPGQQPGQAGMQAQGVNLSAFIAHKLKRGNEAEVELGQLASQRAKTDSVKEFAGMMIKSHQEMIHKLEQFDQGVGQGRGAATRAGGPTRDNTPNSRGQNPGSQERGDDDNNRQDNSSNNSSVDGARNNVRNSESNTDDNPRAADREPSTGTSQSSSGSGTSPQTTATPGAAQPGRAQVAGQAAVNPGGLNGVNQVGPGGQGQLAQGQPGQAAHMAGMSGHVPHMLVAIEDQACDNELQLTKQMLEKHEGDDFEMAYIGQQIVAHTCMLAKLQALKNSGPQELQQLVSQGEQTTRQHLDQAMKIAKELGDDKK